MKVPTITGSTGTISPMAIMSISTVIRMKGIAAVLDAPRPAGTPADPPGGCGPAWGGPALAPLLS
ncbi:hypothetical protein CATMQ487_26080 [Sphaerotilus microaerophilus]|uniref:Uncharacterized protein n=1 Tax=Sphaerotilus microaerophilus TaxID=2914710 RepID=A0ABN6PNQ7_9BURK|nr:hypothetical protein CATMQ487_26080 [Sphaerotilus sp. FB-5]